MVELFVTAGLRELRENLGRNGGLISRTFMLKRCFLYRQVDELLKRYWLPGSLTAVTHGFLPSVQLLRKPPLQINNSIHIL